MEQSVVVSKVLMLHIFFFLFSNIISSHIQKVELGDEVARRLRAITFGHDMGLPAVVASLLVSV